VDESSASVDEAALIYPVVTLEPPFDHTSTRIQLIGRHPSAADAAEWSVETHVRDHCPPMFLVQAEDDPISNVANTAMLADACQAAGVPVERHVLPSGGHGFGMGHPGSPTAAWPGWYEAWLREHRARA
jgi:acetyl esterase/lipase